MTNTINQISRGYGLSALNTQTNQAESTSDFLSSFKDIISTMTMVNGGMSTGQQLNSTINDLMSPLLMLILLEKLVELQVEDDSGSVNTTQETVQNVVSNQTEKSVPSGRPVGGFLSQDYHPGHNGLDFGVVVGTPVETTMDGKVVYAGWNNQGYGNLVIVENGDYKTYYAHLSSIPVSVGDTVTAGVTIGLSGNTGNSTGPHLHYEIRKNNVPIDPTSATLGG
ncbi:MAG TPA: M23 family metallopeptidase [Anaerolineales bacterium]|nr:M23 family metallopeptidase [Anaerolineales bacterium]